MDDSFPFEASEALFEAIVVPSELLVIEAEKMESGGGEILKGLPCPVTEVAVFLGGEDEGKQAKE